MSTTVLNTRIKLRKDSADNFAKVATTLVPLDGEVCIINTGSTGIRLKVGDGTTSIGSLSYIDDDCTYKHGVVIGYYYDGKFYTDTVKSTLVDLYQTQIYIDYITDKTYYYTGKELKEITTSFPLATSTSAGILKLYQEHGQNTDGTITQKLFTDAIDGIAFATEGETGDAAETLILDKPW